MREEEEISSELQDLAQRLKEFREAHPPRTRLPEELWAAAVTLAGEEGLYRTARTLHLDYSNLRRRVEASSERRTSSEKRTLSEEGVSSNRKTSARRRTRRSKKRTEPPAFVELLGESIASGGSRGADCVIEVEGTSGTIMRIRMKMTTPEVLGLIGDWQGRAAQTRREGA
jgi:hypothetical protein